MSDIENAKARLEWQKKLSEARILLAEDEALQAQMQIDRVRADETQLLKDVAVLPPEKFFADPALVKRVRSLSPEVYKKQLDIFCGAKAVIARAKERVGNSGRGFAINTNSSNRR